MSTTQDRVAQTGAARPRRYWPVPVIRAIPALAVGFALTFMADHSPRVGLVAFGAFALLSGAIVLVLSLRLVTERVTRTIFVIQGIVGIIVGVVALLSFNGGLGLLLFIVPVFAAITGFLELYAGLKNRGTATGRDWLTVGAFTAVAAIVFLLLPPDSVLATGLIGAYGILLGVFLVIAGLSLKWAPTTPAAPSATQPKGETAS